MKVVVTGGAGFIGSHLCERLLSQDETVISLDNFNDFYDPAIKDRNIAEIHGHPKAARFKSMRVDIRDRDQISEIFKSEKPDIVVHLAAMAGVRPSIEKPLLYQEVNVTGTQVLLEACRQNQIRNFIFGSSSSVYGNNEKIPFTESDNVDNPISPYAATKKAGELLCHVYFKLYQMNVLCLRFFTVYGPRQRPDLAIHKFTKLIVEGRPVPFYGDGTTQRDYTFIEDILDGVTKAMQWFQKHSSKPVYDVFNLGESKTISLTDMVRTLEKAIGKKAKLERLPMQAGDVQRTFADISKSKRVLGYAPSMDFQQGVGRFVDWYQKVFSRSSTSN